MTEKIDPRDYGLTGRTELVQVDNNTLALVIRRRSRIIMADGRKIVEKVNRIKQTNNTLSVVFQTTAPVCSKTRVYLYERGINVQQIPL